VPELTHAARLADSCLLLVADVEQEDGRSVSVELRSAGESSQLEWRCLTSSSPNGAATGPGQGVVLVLLPQEGLDSGSGSDSILAITTGGGQAEIPAHELRALVDDVGTLARRTLAPLDADARAGALDFLASTLQLVPSAERDALSERLFGIREALRERLPLVEPADDDQSPIQVDRIMAVDERSFYVEGSLRDSELARLTAVSPEGSRQELLERLYIHGGSDGEDASGFVCLFQLGAPSLRSEGWVLELETNREIVSEIKGPPVVSDPRDVRDSILNNPCIAAVPDDALMSDHVVPAIRRVQERIGTEPGIASVTQFGEPPKAPDISIVIPLYLQIEHMEVQLAQFADDPDFFEADLVYVLDSPQQAEELLSYAADLHPIYRVPFRVAVLNRNAGFAAANNAGAGLAAGRLLLLLNSDVLPEGPGWLSKMRTFYDATPGIGALGAKLLYEDDSIQHAGMYFHQLPGTSKWVDGHYFKGMHRSLPAAGESRAVPFVSGSCLMIDRASYEEIGGLNSAYVQGDYEDAELCLRLIESGRENWYLPEAELYHLEGQSYGSAIRSSANRYNMWLHNHLWGDRIAEVMTDPRFAG
jgi:GT2 family glycosyltransferase